LFLVRYLPKWFPGAGFKRYAEYVKQEVARCDEVPFVWAKKQIVCIIQFFLKILVNLLFFL
jgi:hypothetical protein